MRKGRLLVEDSPESLLQLYQCDLLEQVVLRLCRKDDEVCRRSGEIDNNNICISSVVVLSNDDNQNQSQKAKSKSNNKSLSPKSKSKNSYNVQSQMSSQPQSVERRPSRQEIEKLRRRRSSMLSLKAWTEDGFQSESSIYDRVRAMSTVIWLMFFRNPA